MKSHHPRSPGNPQAGTSVSNRKERKGRRDFDRGSPIVVELLRRPQDRLPIDCRRAQKARKKGSLRCLSLFAVGILWLAVPGAALTTRVLLQATVCGRRRFLRDRRRSDRFHIMKSITLECPEQLHQQLQGLVAAGWVKSPEEAVVEALRRFLDSHQPGLQQAQILSDVEWGLHGNQQIA